MEPAATLTNVSNEKVDTINLNNNTLCKQLTALLAGLGLTPALPVGELEVVALSPATVEQVQALTLKQQGGLLKFLGAAMIAIGEKASERTVEAELLDGGGYASIDAAIADVPNRFSGDDAVRIATNLTQVKATIQTIDAQLSPAFILDCLNRAIAARNSVVYAASQARRG